MHAVMFGVRMVNLQLLALGRLIIASELDDECRMTPARYVVLKTLVANPKGIARWKLVRLLGVSGPVVSRMLKALEAQGFLERSRYPEDRRMVRVSITQEGAEVVAEMGYGERVVDDIMTNALPTVAPEWGDRRAEAERAPLRSRAEHEVQIFERFLIRCRKRLGTRTPFTFPWFDGAITAGGCNAELQEPLGTWDPPGAPVNRDARWDDPWSHLYRPDAAC